jgi:hypothetical protein
MDAPGPAVRRAAGPMSAPAPQPESKKDKFPDVTGASAPTGKQASWSTPTRGSLRTRSARLVRLAVASLSLL